ncbi:lactococcin 972 family bacteriocin [Pseudonocardia sp. ICBG1142]
MSSASGIAAANTPHLTSTPAGISQTATPAFNFNSAWAEDGPIPTPADSGVIKGPDQHNQLGEIVGGSVIIPPGGLFRAAWRATSLRSRPGETPHFMITLNKPPGVVTSPSEDNTTRHAVRAQVGGGTWDYGTTVVNGWSNYYHRDRHHGATTSQDERISRADVKRGIWANTSLSRNPLGGAMKTSWRW